jgi:hypothetical protein
MGLASYCVLKILVAKGVQATTAVKPPQVCAL